MFPSRRQFPMKMELETTVFPMFFLLIHKFSGMPIGGFPFFSLGMKIWGPLPARWAWKGTEPRHCGATRGSRHRGAWGCGWCCRRNGWSLARKTNLVNIFLSKFSWVEAGLFFFSKYFWFDIFEGPAVCFLGPCNLFCWVEYAWNRGSCPWLHVWV